MANSTCCFEGGSKLAKCSITIMEAGITGTRNFNVTLDAKDGQCVCDTPLIVIISDCKGGYICLYIQRNFCKPNTFGTKEKAQFREVSRLERVFMYSKYREQDLKTQPV